MAKTYFTLTGTKHYYGRDFIEKGMQVKLVKEPDNDYDREAIRVELPGLGKIGYVANSPYTVAGESMSAAGFTTASGTRALQPCGLSPTEGSYAL